MAAGATDAVAFVYFALLPDGKGEINTRTEKKAAELFLLHLSSLPHFNMQSILSKGVYFGLGFLALVTGCLLETKPQKSPT